MYRESRRLISIYREQQRIASSTPLFPIYLMRDPFGARMNHVATLKPAVFPVSKKVKVRYGRQVSSGADRRLVQKTSLPLTAMHAPWCK